MRRVTTPRTAPGTGQPTLDEVARVAGVSRATASRAINGGQRVSARAQSAVDTAVRTVLDDSDTAAVMGGTAANFYPTRRNGCP